MVNLPKLIGIFYFLLIISAVIAGCTKKYKTQFAGSRFSKL
jgi:hypothetical protein